MLTGKIKNMAKRHIEFMLNFDEIVKTKVNSEYRYKIFKLLNPVAEQTALEFKILDTKEKKLYKIIMDDYTVSINPFLSNKTYIQLMNKKFSRFSIDGQSTYQNRFAKYLQEQLIGRLKAIVKNVDDKKIQLKFSEIIDYIEKSLGFKDKEAKKYLKKHAKNIEQLLQVVSSTEFKIIIKNSEKYERFLKDSSQSIISKLLDVNDADEITFQDKIANRVKDFFNDFKETKKQIKHDSEK